MHTKILLVEDSLEFQKVIESTMGFKYKIDCVGSVEDARARIASGDYALILLDVMLPDGSAFDLVRGVRESLELSHTPIIFMTAKNSISDKFTGFSLGADDYVTKPFDATELMLRVDSLILKSQKRKYYSENIQCGPIRLEVMNMAIFVTIDGAERQISATPIEFKLLLKLIQNNQKVLSRQQLLDSVWGNGVYIEDRSIDKHISAIRKKIHPFGELIKTMSGVGYKFQM
jgi:DNA-binding response OmpR family regulator